MQRSVFFLLLLSSSSPYQSRRISPVSISFSLLLEGIADSCFFLEGIALEWVGSFGAERGRLGRGSENGPTGAVPGARLPRDRGDRPGRREPIFFRFFSGCLVLELKKEGRRLDFGTYLYLGGAHVSFLARFFLFQGTLSRRLGSPEVGSVLEGQASPLQLPGGARGCGGAVLGLRCSPAKIGGSFEASFEAVTFPDPVLKALEKPAKGHTL